MDHRVAVHKMESVLSRELIRCQETRIGYKFEHPAKCQVLSATKVGGGYHMVQGASHSSGGLSYNAGEIGGLIHCGFTLSQLPFLLRQP